MIKNNVLEEIERLYNSKGAFNKKELDFLFTNLNRSKYQIVYCWYRSEKSTKRLGYVIDSAKDSPRRSMFFNTIEVITKRDPNDLEFLDICKNFGSGNRRFTCFWYDNINKLFQDDLKNGVDPDIKIYKFIKYKLGSETRNYLF